MAILTHKCPHCLTEHIGLRSVAGVGMGGWNSALFLMCPKCDFPSCAHLKSTGQGAVDPGSLHQQPGDVSSYNWVLVSLWPAPPPLLIPENLPSDVERIYVQAERYFPVAGNEEAAGTMYRKALDVGLTIIAPSVTGVLKTRITKLVQQNLLTPSLGEWADQIRLLGNETAHEIDQPTRDELESLRNFSDLVLRYLFTLPALVTARKAPVATTAKTP
jgi:hypothetical protein